MLLPVTECALHAFFGVNGMLETLRPLLIKHLAVLAVITRNALPVQQAAMNRYATTGLRSYENRGCDDLRTLRIEQQDNFRH